MTDICPPASPPAPLTDNSQVHWSSACDSPTCPLPPQGTNTACWSTQTLLSGGLCSVKHYVYPHIELCAPDRDAPPHLIPCAPDVSLCLHREWRHRCCCQHLPWAPFSPLSTGGSGYLCAEDACLLTSCSWHCPWHLWGTCQWSMVAPSPLSLAVLWKRSSRLPSSLAL